MRRLFSWPAAIVGVALAVATPCTNAHPIPIRFSGMITNLDDPLHLFADTPLPAGSIEGLYTIDPEAGTIAFGDGTVGQRLPDGSASVDGTYRYGGGGGNRPPAVILFRHCFVGTVLGFACVPLQGNDAYVLDLPLIASDGLRQTFALALTGVDLLGRDERPSLLPPPLGSADSAAFAWRFETADRVAVATGVIESIAAVPEPAPLWLVLLAALAWPLRRATARAARRPWRTSRCA